MQPICKTDVAHIQPSFIGLVRLMSMGERSIEILDQTLD